MNEYYGYIRVSTTRQGIQGVSLQEQQAAVEHYASLKGFKLIQVFEDQLTAAKLGRPAFNQMLKLLKAGRAKGVVIHKIDRSARNLKDWASLGDLMDAGIEVHFANESLDLSSRGGRLSADIQAVVAADYIRNLREETKKGFYGRLKQGLYPMPAPLGYVNCGKGNTKTISPDKAPLVRQAFQLYATRRYNLKSLNRELYARGLRGKSGKRLSLNALSLLLNNPFYVGIIKIKKTSECFEGKHEALISPELFQACQDILQGRTNAKTKRHNLVFRRLLSCAHCNRHLIGEVHAGHVYYRCQAQECPMTTVRENVVESAIKEKLVSLQLSAAEGRMFDRNLTELKTSWAKERLSTVALLEARLLELSTRLGKLTDAFLDGTIEKSLYEEHKKALLIERKDLEMKALEFKNGRSVVDELRAFLEFTKNAINMYEKAFPDKKRRLVELITSKCVANKKSVVFQLRSPFSIVADRPKIQNGSPSADVHRNAEQLWPRLLDIFRGLSLISEFRSVAL